MSRMTDREIIQALECCDDFEWCGQCSLQGVIDCRTVLTGNALALITRQQAEIENLQADKEALINGQETLQKEIERLSTSAKQWEETAKQLLLSKEKAKAEAIKEFAKDIHEEICKALDNNYKVRNQRIERHLTDELSVTCDVFVQYVEGNIDALRGIDGFVCDYVKEMVGEDK